MLYFAAQIPFYRLNKILQTETSTSVKIKLKRIEKKEQIAFDNVKKLCDNILCAYIRHICV